MKHILSQDIPHSVLVARITALEKAVESNEKIQAQFTRAYTEVIAMLNAISEEITKNYTEQELLEFRNRVNREKLGVIKLLKDAADEVEQSSQQSAESAPTLAQNFTAGS